MPSVEWQLASAGRSKAVNEVIDYLPVALYCLLILLPLVPAFLLFKLLPCSATVEGPLQGLQLKLGGAFAGYFAVLLVSFMVVQPIIKDRQTEWARYVALLETSVYQDWRVTGRIDISDGMDPALVTCFVRPPDLHIQPDGSFRFDIPMQLLKNGLPDAPIIVFYAREHIPATVNLLPGIAVIGGAQPLAQHYDLKSHTVVFDSPIILAPKASIPAYAPRPQPK